MPQFGWNNCPASVHQQVMALVTGLQAALGHNLLGVYLHGSLAMGCFNPQRSDLDVLAVTRGALAPTARPQLARLLLLLSGVPAAIELSVLDHASLYPWRHPAPYEFHYSEDWRDRTQAHLDNVTWPEVESAPTDADLAAHITIAVARGVVLWGVPINEALPCVPPADYADSILADFRWARDLLGVNPVYFVLNACRVLAFLEEGRLLSKDEGGAWGLGRLPAIHHPIIQQALSVYRGEAATEAWGRPGLEAFAQDLERALGLA